MRSRTEPRRTALLLVLAAGASLAIASLAGCSSQRSRANEERILKRAGLTPSERQPGTPADQERAEAPLTGVRVAGTDSIADVRILVGSPDREPVPTSSVVEPESPRTVTGDASAGAPRPATTTTTAETARPAGASMGFVDSVVGQINGRPVYASEFFAPMDARLRSEAARLPPARWVEQTRQVVLSALRERMREELLLAEFQASLTREQRQGLLAFVGNLRQRLVAENLGSESLASSRLEEAEGLTLDEKIQQQRDTEIIRAQLTRAVGDRLYVSWREIELDYERNYDQYNPAPIARLRMIQVPAANAERVEQVRTALATGTPFAEVASSFSDFRASEGGLWTIGVEREGYAKTRIFAPEELNSVAIGLSPGQVSEPFAWANSTVWLHLEEIEQPPTKSLYDAQIEIHNRLRFQRWQEEEGEYYVRLFGRASVTDLDEMFSRLMEIATQRYLQQPAPTPAPGGR